MADETTTQGDPSSHPATDKPPWLAKLERDIESGPAEGERHFWSLSVANYIKYIHRPDSRYRSEDELREAIRSSVSRYCEARGRRMGYEEETRIDDCLLHVQNEGRSGNRVTLTHKPHSHARLDKKRLTDVDLVDLPITPSNKLQSENNRGWSVEEKEGVWMHPLNSTILWLKACYKPDDILYIGPNRHSDWTAPGEKDRYVRMVRAWVKHIEGLKEEGLYYLPDTMSHHSLQPLTGLMALTDKGKPSPIGLGAIREFRYVLYEADSLELGQQVTVALRNINRWQIRSVTYSGSKSLHMLCALPKRVKNWQRDVVESDIGTSLRACGTDKNALTSIIYPRTPGCIRHNADGTTRIQRLMWCGWPLSELPPPILRPQKRCPLDNL